MRNTKRIAFITDYMESEYSQKLCKGAGDYAKEHGMELVAFTISQINSKDFAFDYQMLSVASHVRPDNFDGVIFASATQLCSTSVDYLCSYLKSFSPLPVVSVGNAIPGIPSVAGTSETGFRAMIAHLIENGHAKRNGGRVMGQPHIKGAEEAAEKQLLDDIERALK